MGKTSAAARLERAGCRIAPVDLSEFAKAEGAVTCCSLILDDRPGLVMQGPRCHAEARLR